jgi:hypothetical protein
VTDDNLSQDSMSEQDERLAALERVHYAARRFLKAVITRAERWPAEEMIELDDAMQAVPSIPGTAQPIA